jgi:hypothetical protein
MNPASTNNCLVFTPRQGQYLAFIHAYTLVLGRPPAEADIQKFFRVTPPTVHQLQAAQSDRAHGRARAAVLSQEIRPCLKARRCEHTPRGCCYSAGEGGSFIFAVAPPSRTA